MQFPLSPPALPSFPGHGEPYQVDIKCHDSQDFLGEMVMNSRSGWSYRLSQFSSPLGLQRESVQQAKEYPHAGYSSSSL